LRSAYGIATGAVLFGPNTVVMADITHHTFGNETAVEHAVQERAAKMYE
jgi:hypothetical protein